MALPPRVNPVAVIALVVLTPLALGSLYRNGKGAVVR
jgi:hypothetical protein